MPRASEARKKPKEELVVRGEAVGRPPEERKGPQRLPPFDPKATERRGDSTCTGCGSTHHGLLQLQYTQSLEQQIALLELENRFLKEPPPQPLHYPPPPPPPSHPYPPPSSHSYPHPPPPTHSFAPSHLPSHRHRPPLWNEMIPEAGESRPSTGPPPPPSDTELLHRLEEYSQKLMQLERKLKEKMRESRGREESMSALKERIRQLEGNAATKTDSDASAKRALMEEILDLQRRIDQLTPILAQKEAAIARIENEKDEALAKIRALKAENAQLQVRVSERSGEEAARAEVEEERRRQRNNDEIRLREAHDAIDNNRKKERRMTEEIATLNIQMRQLQMEKEQQRVLIEKQKEDNEKMAKECTRMTAEISRMEIRVEEGEREKERSKGDREAAIQLHEVREKEHALRIQLSQALQQLKAEKETGTLLQEEASRRRRGKRERVQMREGTTRENETRQGRMRMERELEALQALANALSLENDTLRQDKITVGEQLEGLRMKVLEREKKVHELEQSVRDGERAYEDAISRVEEETTMKRMRTLELEELGQKLKDLSESLPSHSPSARVPYSREESHGCGLPRPLRPSLPPPHIDDVILMARTALATTHMK